MNTNIRTYSELITIPTFRERYEYLKLGDRIGVETFGYDRYLNQLFYSSKEWKNFRREIIIRDKGNDLGIDGREIGGLITIHHIVPIRVDDIVNRRLEILLNPDNVICTSTNTHKAIHYGDVELLVLEPIERKLNDTCPWRRN